MGFSFFFRFCHLRFYRTRKKETTFKFSTTNGTLSLNSLDFLKKLLILAKDVVKAEKQLDLVDEQKKAKTALTELFTEVKKGKTRVLVERILTDIDEIVRLVRFLGWQNTKAGEREAQKALRKVIYLKYQVKDQDLFDKTFGYIRQYY